MKYVRTKNGIYDAIINTSEYSWGEIIWRIGNETNIAYSKQEYERQINELKQADAIEELCDEFVIYDVRKKKRLHFIDLKSLLGYCAENGLDKTEIRGAVWTGSGLIYAAKMNDKGVLELL